MATHVGEVVDHTFATTIDLTGATQTRIRVQKPDGSVVNFSGVVSGAASLGKIIHAGDATDYPLAGQYVFNADVIKAGKQLYGDAVVEEIKALGAPGP